MKLSSGALALFSLALCLPLTAQDAVTPLPSAAKPASVAAASTNTVGLSDIRIVRLSQVRGKVYIDRHIGRGFEEAFVNIPITGGVRLRTDLGLAEVEFEDNSALRLTPDTDVEFTLLKRNLAGATISNVKVLRGMVYASLAKTKDSTFTIAAGETSVQLYPASHIRLTVDSAKSNLSVLDGNVDFIDGSTTTALKRGKSLDFDIIGYKPPEPAKLEETAFDQWDRNGVDYQKQYSSLRSSGGTGLLYGTSDLNYYGGFVNMPGCGNVWRPYFASAAWTPYDNGTWAYYPSVGYSWVSPYPWGWMPYHSGTWMSCGAAGWGWMPGSQFMGLQNTALVSTSAGAGGSRSLVTAPLPPRSGSPAMVLVNARPLAVSSVSAPGTFTFRTNSAGLGVPRDAFGDLKSISSDVAHHGQVNTEIERSMIGPSPAFANGNRAGSGRDVSSASRSVATFSRPGNDARNGNMSSQSGWSQLSRDSMTRDSMRGGEPASAPMSRQATMTQSSGNSSGSSQGSTAASKK
ncbi:MAG TPA: FecR family protein [Acidobacteriaceae bacterium]|nr:FecR family protein [Acidobacteriaceae bacterium]